MWYIAFIVVGVVVIASIFWSYWCMKYHEKKYQQDIKITRIPPSQVATTQTVHHSHYPVVPPPQNVYGTPPPQSSQCIVCKAIKPLAVIIPCSHECVCLDCGTMISNQTNQCPLCNEPMESVWPK